MMELRQVMLVAEKLKGEDVSGVLAEDFDEPWRSIFQRVEKTRDRDMAERVLWKATAGLEDRNELVERVMACAPSKGSFCPFPSFGELAESLPPIEWLWWGWVPVGLLSLLGAAPGAGKSMVALDLARRIIDGDTWPDSSTMPCPGQPVLYVDAEAVPQIQNERAEAWGMDRWRLYPMLPPEPYGPLDLGDEQQQDRLLRMVHRIEPALVIVDSLSSISLRGENNVEDVRGILQFLAAVAGEWRIAVLLIHHLRKRGSAAALGGAGLISADDFRGSSHIIAMARSVMGLSIVQAGPEPDRNGPRRLEVLKTNLVRYPEALGVVFEGTHEGPPLVRYGGAPKPYREPTQAEQCAVWLVGVLEEAGEAVKPKEVVRMAKEAGFARGVVYRAREQLADVVADTHGRRHPENSWILASEVQGTG